MAKLKMENLTWSLFVFCFIFAPSVQLDTNKDIDTSNVIVEFSPYVSIWDQYANNRYDLEQVIPLISKVVTRFSKIYINLDDDKHQKSNQSSLQLSLFAAAIYNCQRNPTNRIEIWIGVKKSGCGCDSQDGVIKRGIFLADDANTECPGTVTTILIRKIPLTGCTPNPCAQNLTNRYRWAVLATFSDYCNGHIDPYEQYYVSFTVLEYSKEVDLSKNMSLCKFEIISNARPLSIWKKIYFADTTEDRVLNMTGLINIWKRWLSGCNNCILSQAFDSYSYQTRSWKTNGWWYLDQDPANTSTELYRFQDKITVAGKLDNAENPRKFGWLTNSKKFNWSTTGIRYTDHLSFDVYAKDFCRILNRLENGYIVPKPTNKFLSSCKTGSQLTIVYDFSYPLSFINRFKTDWNNITLLLHVYYHSKEKGLSSIDFSVLDALHKAKLRYGFFFEIDICDLLNQNEITVPIFWKNKLLDVLSDPNSTMYLFTFHQTKDSIRLGATRMFRQRSVMFKACREMVLNNRNYTTEVGYLMTKYETENNYYSSPVDMQNFVKFVQLMTEWVDKEENTMIFIGDDTEIPSQNSPSTGWYIYDKKKYEYITSREQALKLSRLRYPKQEIYIDSSLSTNQIVMIVLICLILFALMFVLSIYYIKRHYKENSLSDQEIEYFLKGDDCPGESEAHNVPYDKHRYEIPNNQFKIELGTSLGSGEFGTVKRGAISTATGDVSVAVKTTNPQKHHKTILNGLLSEIKVLAYVGKHENITELIGANTTNLKDGKVYIFLELCHMGSLEKYLRDMRSIVKSTLTDQTENIEMQYVNACAVTKNMLDASLSEDLYRWSAEICKGMKYLSEKHVVHADLATRNVLLNLQRIAKICDFGLSRRMYNYTNYVKTQQEPLPWKWMAPESLRYMHFNEKSDVWAYGITLWEIYSLGSLPYVGLSWNIDFVQMLEDGLALPDPEFVDEDKCKITEIIEQCRKILPEERPKFSSILMRFTDRKDDKLDM